MTGTRARTVPTDELGPGLLAEIASVWEEATGVPLDDAWERIGPGLHVLAEASGRVVSHAMIVDRAAYVGHEADQAIDVGYVELVATRRALAGSGVGAEVMREVARIIGDEYALGALSTDDRSRYEALGWHAWSGPTLARTADGTLVRTPDADDSVMVLRTARTPQQLDAAGPIAIDWRSGALW
ncbi:MAG TPA: aminoglycoside 2'-N-acetyltransferase [Candidatus Limnocylindria bacterium]